MIYWALCNAKLFKAYVGAVGVWSLKTPCCGDAAKRIRKLSWLYQLIYRLFLSGLTKWEILCNRERTSDAIVSATVIDVCLRFDECHSAALFRGRIFNEVTSRRQPISSKGSVSGTGRSRLSAWILAVRGQEARWARREALAHRDQSKPKVAERTRKFGMQKQWWPTCTQPWYRSANRWS